VPENDELWTPEREDKRSVGLRCREFVRLLATRPETEVGVVTHSALLLTLFNTAVITEDPFLLSWFATGEMRSVVLVFP